MVSRGATDGADEARRFAWAGWALTLAVALLLLWMAGSRFQNVHQRTFDLAFYGRLAWGLAVFDGWDPLQHAHVLGLHVSPVLVPLGWLGRLFGTVPVLLTAQVAAVAGGALVLGRLASRHLGPVGHLIGPIALLAHPNLSHVTTYEFHPGTLAVLPLAWALERLDAGDSKGVARGAIGLLLCREDLALVALMLALLVAWPHRPGARERDPAQWRRGVQLGVGALSYMALFALVLHPIFAPKDGPFQAHFGHLGQTPAEAVDNLLANPLRVFAHVDQAKLTWLPRVLAPMAFLPLFAPRLALAGLPVLAIAFFSAFPTTVNLDSHYLTLGLPPLVASAIVGAGRLGRWLPRLAPVAPFGLAAAAMVGWALAGQTPTAAAFSADRETVARRIILDAIPEGASVQAPSAFLPHLIERPRIHMGWKTDEGADFVVLDLWHRVRYGGREVLLRTSEEPFMRGWLAKDDFAVIDHAGRYVLLERGRDPRGGVARDYIEATDRTAAGRRLTECLRLVGAERVREGAVALELHATGPCPTDLAIRIGERVDLLFDGLLSPAHLQAGDRLRSEHRFDGRVLRLSALRSSGARPLPEDPAEVLVTPHSVSGP